MIEVRQTEVFAAWFAELRDREARARITVRIRRLSLGNPGDVKPVGSGVSEMRIDYGPGYRVYFVRAAPRFVSYFAAVTNEAKIAISNGPSNWRRKFRKDNMARKTTRWDAADTLETKEDIAAYLDAVLEDGDPDLLKAALGDIARAKGMTQIAHAAGLGRTNLYKALSPEGNPEFVTVARVLKALGLRLSIVI
jgi:probable addiction module antidote protein/putative addiction module killer protein